MVRRAVLFSVCALLAACGGSENSPAESPDLHTVKQSLALFSYTASNINQATNPSTSVQSSVYLNAGETVMIGTCILSGTTPVGETVLRFFSPSGTELSPTNGYWFNCNGDGSRFTYTPTLTGTFTIRAGCFTTRLCSGTVSLSRRRGAPVAFSAVNTHNALANTYNKQYSLAGGDVVRVSTCGYNATGARASGDTYLRLYKNNGGVFTEVASNDTAATGSCGTSAEIVYTVPSAGYYQVRVGCAGDTACSGNLAVYVE